MRKRKLTRKRKWIFFKIKHYFFVKSKIGTNFISFFSISTQESRKLVIAQLQNIVYNHFLPEILAPSILDKFGLRIASDSTYYPEANPTVKNEFSAAANRYGHSQVQVRSFKILQYYSTYLLVFTYLKKNRETGSQTLQFIVYMTIVFFSSSKLAIIPLVYSYEVLCTT